MKHIISRVIVAVACPAICLMLARPASADPFKYSQPDFDCKTFVGTHFDSVSGSFIVTAPAKFPKNVGSATADIKVVGINKIADATAPLIASLPIDQSSPVGSKITNAISLNPAVWSNILPNGSTAVSVTIANPNVDPADYGEYEVKVKAKDRVPEASQGIGEGSGVTLCMKLVAPECTDVHAPNVYITSPSEGASLCLASFAVNVNASDPVEECGSGLASLAASISSAGCEGNQALAGIAIALSLDATLPVVSGLMVHGTGSYTPGNGFLNGLTLANAFNSTYRSGIGTYTVKGTAVDGAGNVGTATSTFTVNYDLEWLTQSGNSSAKLGRLEFRAKNCAGSFMYDQTVVVELYSGSTLMASHSYGTGAVFSCVQIDPGSGVPFYKTHFKRGDLLGAPTAAATYTAVVKFMDIDGCLMQQAISIPITF